MNNQQSPTSWLIRASALITFLVIIGCSPDVQIQTKPIDGSPSAERAELKQVSINKLKQDKLYASYKKSPKLAIQQLYQNDQNDTDPNRLIAVAELCGSLGKQLQTQSPNQAAGCYLDAASLTQAAALNNKQDHHSKQLRLIYNEACSSFAYILFKNKDDLGGVTLFTGPLTSYHFSIDHSPYGSVELDFFDALVPADHIKLKDVKMKRERQSGIGGALIGHRAKQGGAQSDPFVSPVGYALPVNALLTFGSSHRAKLQLRDLMKNHQINKKGHSHTLAADWTASIAFLYKYAPKKNIGFRGMLNPKDYEEHSGLHRLQRFDPHKTPVILVHGLMSSPETWMRAINHLRRDPVLRERYQAIVYRYPTGYPITENAAKFRGQLAAFQKKYDPHRSNSKMRQMVIVCHSMGGNLSDLQIRNVSNQLEKTLFDQPIDQLKLKSKEKQQLHHQLQFKANPDISRVVYLASPHRGSNMATRFIGRLGTKLIKLPQNMLFSGDAQKEISNVDGISQIGRMQISKKLDSVRSLRPDNPLFPIVLSIPVAPHVRYHSIIGQVNQSKPVEKGTDTVVEYWSSHLDGAASEKIVDSSHTQITDNEDAIQEVSRILYLHLGKAPQNSHKFR